MLRLHETIKDAVDPHGILSPGKSGIWPKRLRKARA
jgi:4-cresol dehydrogenase (hydroxylating)